MLIFLPALLQAADPKTSSAGIFAILLSAQVKFRVGKYTNLKRVKQVEIPGICCLSVKWGATACFIQDKIESESVVIDLFFIKRINTGFNQGIEFQLSAI